MVKMIPVRRLNKRGMQRHMDFFNPMDEVGVRAEFLGKPVDPEELDSDRFSEDAGFEMFLPETLPDDKYLLGKTVRESFGERYGGHMYDSTLWNWMCLRYHGLTVGPARKTRELVVDTVYSEEEAYGPSAVRQRQYRNRLWGPTFAYDQFGEASRVMLTGKVPEMSDVMDALYYFNMLTGPIVRVLDALYYDEERHAINGVSKPSSNYGGLRDGTVRDCLAQIGQIATTRSIMRMSEEEILAALPEAEYGDRVEEARVKLGLSVGMKLS